jgi:glutamine---fructose-6-phosphate transaminase (isomerizing)
MLILKTTFMCGIVGYVGSGSAYPILIKGLARLEYRGYDSAGVAIVQNDEMVVYKCKGKVADLKQHVAEGNVSGSVGIGHTRWATHGPPNDINAHPHVSSDGNLAMIHNGIIENYATIKEELINRGHKFVSDTDTEVLVHLIEDIKNKTGVDLFEAVRIALNEVVGAYAILVIDKNRPDQIICAKKSSPLVIGIGLDGEYYVGSDATPIVEYTRNVVYLEDEEVALIDTNEDLKIVNIHNQEKTPYIHELEMQLETLEKGGYDYFMLKEIYEQPRSIKDCYRGRMNLEQVLSA